MNIEDRAPIKIFLLCLAFFLCLSAFIMGKGNATGQDLWQLLKQEKHFALIRHALAPGTGDPPDFSIRDCTTQRNLSERGRNQARNIGRRFRDEGELVFSAL